MKKEEILKILNQYKNDKLSDAEILKFIEDLPYEDINFARIDHHRAIRVGFPEVIFCQDKTPEQTAIIAKKIVDHGSNLLATRANIEKYEAVKKYLPDAKYNAEGKTITFVKTPVEKLEGKVIAITAGTSDIPIAAETVITGEMLGLDISMISDVGVAGIHRVMDHRTELSNAAVIIVLAGMEGALASVIAGLVQSPVIAVPTSVGYGASFSGLTPLLGMLNSCVPGIAVMNIDNGFGAASLAFKILNTLKKIKDAS